MLPLHQWLLLSAEDGIGEKSSEVQSAAALPVDWLFNASSEPVLIVDAATQTIVHANLAAAGLFGVPAASLVGTWFLSAFAKSSAEKVRECLATAQSSGSAGALIIRAQRDSGDLRMQLSLVHASPKSYLLVRLDPNVSQGNRSSPPVTDSLVFKAIHAASVGFLITDAGFQIEYVNQAFVEMIKANSAAAVRGGSLIRWLRLRDADLSRLQEHLLQRQAAALLTARLCPNFGHVRTVEVCAVPVPDDRNTCWGFTVRALPPLN